MARHGGEFRLQRVPAELVPAVGRAGFGARDGYWCKRFPDDTPHLDRAWANFQRLILPMLRQVAGLDPVPWAEALEEVCRRLEPAGVDWWLTGSAALAVRGIAVSPGDLDLVVADGDAVRVGELLLDGLMEPVAPADWFCSWWGRAMLPPGGAGPAAAVPLGALGPAGSSVLVGAPEPGPGSASGRESGPAGGGAGARVEWVGGVGPAADEPLPTDFGPAAAARLETVRWRDWSVRVPPLDLQRAVSLRRGLHDRVALIDGSGASCVVDG